MTAVFGRGQLFDFLAPFRPSNLFGPGEADTASPPRHATLEPNRPAWCPPPWIRASPASNPPPSSAGASPGARSTTAATSCRRPSASTWTTPKGDYRVAAGLRLFEQLESCGLDALEPLAQEEAASPDEVALWNALADRYHYLGCPRPEREFFIVRAALPVSFRICRRGAAGTVSRQRPSNATDGNGDNEDNGDDGDNGSPTMGRKTILPKRGESPESRGYLPPSTRIGGLPINKLAARGLGRAKRRIRIWPIEA